jgi:hypothetical protein
MEIAGACTKFRFNSSLFTASDQEVNVNIIESQSFGKRTGIGNKCECRKVSNDFQKMSCAVAQHDKYSSLVIDFPTCETSIRDGEWNNFNLIQQAKYGLTRYAVHRLYKRIP